MRKILRRMLKRSLIQNDEQGFSLQSRGRAGLLYREGDRTTFVDSEFLTDGTLAIVGNSITAWEPPHENEFLDEKIRERILNRIKAAFESRGYHVEIEWHGWRSKQ